jgi:dCMP deaminase
MNKWDKRFLDLAEHVSTWSKDPSTKVGAVIAHGKRLVSVGFNGFPPDIEDTEERLNNRELKYKLIVHGEVNAISFANEDITGFTLYTWPFMPCSKCAEKIVKKGIKRVVAPVMPEYLKGRWKDDMELAAEMFKEANITLDLVEDSSK